MDLDLQEHFPLANPLPPEIENSHRIIHGRYLMWSMQFLLSLSLLSLFISYLTGISLYYSYTYYFTTFFLPLITRELERKYMFLLCNGLILVFLVGFRGVNDGDQDHHVGFDGEILLDKHHDNCVIDVVTGVQKLESDVVALGGSKSDTEASLEGKVLEEEGEDCDDSFMEEDDHDPKEEEKGGEEEEGRKDEDEGADKELVGSRSCTEDDEELNKKFDEFIRKMKEELRLEAKEYQIVNAA